MSQKISPVVAIVAVVIVVLLVAVFGYRRLTGTGLSRVEEEKFLKPVQMPPPGQAPSLIPPPPTGGNATPTLPGPGQGMPVPPPPPGR